MTTMTTAPALTAPGDEQPWTLRLATTGTTPYVIAQSHGHTQEQVEQMLPAFRALAVTNCTEHNQMVEQYAVGSEWARHPGDYALTAIRYSGFEPVETLHYPLVEPQPQR